MGARDHIELGSSIRSACAFGWERALVEDRFSAWFGTDRVTRSEARGAARRGHNPIRLIPITQQVRLTYNEVTVVNVQGRGRPLHRTNLARGANQLIVIPDESELRLDGEDWERFGQHIEFTHLDLPGATFVYHYRLIASIAMAEVARQVGQKPRKPGRQPREGRLQYDKALQPRMEPQGEIVYLEDLMEY
jgi:hypothetical protein